MLALTDLSLDAYQGHLASSASLDARQALAGLSFQAALDGVELAPLLRDLALDEAVQLSGALNLSATAAAGAATYRSW